MEQSKKGASLDPLAVIAQFYDPAATAYAVLLAHSRAVARKSRAVARKLNQPVDRGFIEEAALLHDIGIIRVYAPDVGCYGQDPYVTHGVWGRRMLEQIGLKKHALVCERHVGAGLSAAEISAADLPLPVRDMQPVTMEETIVAYADKFFSKSPGMFDQQKPVARIVGELARHSQQQAETFRRWVDYFEPDLKRS